MNEPILEQDTNFALFPKKLLEKFNIKLSKQHFEGGIYIFSNAAASVLSLAFASVLGRVLSFQDFALVSLINGLISLVGIFFGSLGATMTYKTSFLMGSLGEKASIFFWYETRKKVLKISLVLSILWLMATPFLTKYFQVTTLTPLILFTPIILVALASYADRGLLFSKFELRPIALITALEPLLRLLLTIIFIVVSLQSLAYISIPIASVVVFLLGWYFVYKNREKLKGLSEKFTYSFPFKFFTLSLFSGISAIIFLNLDVILAKHYLPPDQAGVYSLAALIGKMTYFLGALASPFTLPLVSKNEGAGKDSNKFLLFTALATVVFCIPAFIATAGFGKELMPLLFGKKALATLPFIGLLSFALICFSVAKVYSDYYLAKKSYFFSTAALFLGILQLLLLAFFHSGVQEIVNVMAFVWILYFVVTFVLHLFAKQIKPLEAKTLLVAQVLTQQLTKKYQSRSKTSQ